MSLIRSRDLVGPGQRTAIRSLLQGLLVGELIAPSKRLWIASAWASDIEVIDNTARQYAVLAPDWPSAKIRLSSVIRALVERGSEIVVILRDVPHNHQLAACLSAVEQGVKGSLQILMEPDFHEKGIVGDDFVLDGSMNLTWNGIEVNDEHLVLRCDPSSVNERRLAMEEKWGARLKKSGT